MVCDLQSRRRKAVAPRNFQGDGLWRVADAANGGGWLAWGHGHIRRKRRHAGGQRSIAESVTVAENGTLEAGLPVGAISNRPASPGILHLGGLTLESGSHFAARIDGSTPGLGYSQVAGQKGQRGHSTVRYIYDDMFP
jgi:hypothetical protein